MREFDNQVRETLRQRVVAIEKLLSGDVIFYYGPIFPSVQKRFRDFIEQLKENGENQTRLIVFLNTPGGHAETVEKLVEIIRFHYQEVFFVVPDEAMSAGTIFCMSGDKIYMDYTSSLGPIDPQIHNGKDWVPALGYLDQVEKMIKKSEAGELTDAELIIFQAQDLAMLSRFEQAKNLTITLLKKWLVDYKFKDWETHQSSPLVLNKPVTLEQKVARAEEIATMLSDNKLWHSHGRMIGISTLKNVLKLRIEDYSKNTEIRSSILAYSDFLTDYIERNDYKHFLHSRCFF
ncbi:MAG: ATP-dependent Clp protease proteolytic subunit [Rhodoferax sp.]|nr:ATP-dependent Clp protease proteolytic subunit [Rhodoferax sp.]